MALPLPEPLFDGMKATINDLRNYMEKGTFTGVQIIESYLSKIEKHNTKGAKCRAVISTPPRFLLLSMAAKLDKERAEGNSRGPLHGIPILLKVSICQHPVKRSISS